MKIQDFVRLVEDEERAEQEAEIQRREELVCEALPRFVENVEVWTDDFEDYEAGEIRVEWDQHDMFRLALPITWCGLKGEICTDAWGKAASSIYAEWDERPSRLKIWWGPAEKDFEDIYLPGDANFAFEVNYMEQAELLDPLELGRFLVEVLAKRKTDKEEQQFWAPEAQAAK